MNPIQLLIIAVVVLLIVITIGYYWYQEIKFKKMVENNFNRKIDDIIIDENKAVVLDGTNDTKTIRPDTLILQKDTHIKDDGAVPDVAIDALFGEIKQEAPDEVIVSEPEAPEDSVEAFFLKIDKVPFPYTHVVDHHLDFIIDIAFEEPTKLKIVPEIAGFTQKSFIFYILDKDNHWQVFEKGCKYIAQAIKLVVELVDRDGIISQAQIANIYNECYKFVLNHQAHIRQSNYETSIKNIQSQIKHLDEIELSIDLFLITKDKLSYAELLKFFNQYGFANNNGKFNYVKNESVLFSISSDTGAGLEFNQNYNLLLINSALHLQTDPFVAIDSIFDCAEQFTQQFEARLLTTNKEIFAEKDFNTLTRYITDYISDANKNGIELGGILLKRLFSN